MRSIRWRARAGMAALAALFVVVATAHAATVPNGFVDSIFVRVPSDATAMKFAPDGRLFVAQQSGKLRVVQNGTLLATPFLTRPGGCLGRARAARRRLRPGLRDQQFRLRLLHGDEPDHPQPRQPLHRRTATWRCPAARSCCST